MKRKWEVNLYSFYNVTGMQLHLEHMAQKGWFLDKITNYRWCYHKAEPKKLHYAVSYYAKASAFEPEMSEGQQTFQEFCDHAGWHVAAGNAKLQVFYNEAEDPTPIYTDPESELSAIGAMAKIILPSYWLVFAMNILQIGTLISAFKTNPLDLLADSLRLYTTLSMVLLGIYFAVDIINYYRWRKKAKAAAESDEIVPTAKSGNNPMVGLLALAALNLFCGIVSTGNPGSAYYLLTFIAGVVLIYFIVNGVKEHLKKKKVETRRNRIITLAVDGVLACVLAAVMTFSTFCFVGTQPPKNPDGLLLTVAMITGEEGKDIEGNFHHSGSIFLSKNQGWQYPESGQSLSYEVIDVHLPFVQDFCKEKLLHEYDRRRSYDENAQVQAPAYAYREITSAPWKADSAWQLYLYDEAKTTYLLQYGSRFAKLELSFEPDETEKLRVYDALN